MAHPSWASLYSGWIHSHLIMNEVRMKIVVFGLGYVGLANAVLLASRHEVVAVDIVEQKVNDVNNRIAPIEDAEVTEAFRTQELNLRATTDAAEALEGADVAIIATPTDYEVDTNRFNTSSVEAVMDQLTELAPDVITVIKSTVPIGFTVDMEARYPALNLVFSPEFLREGRALYDNQHPSRVIAASSNNDHAELVASLLAEASLDDEVPVLVTHPTEAESIKLFSNTYLAMRVAYFNEMDTFARMKGLDPQQIIDGVGLDPRIGSHYNNPSFGYGGYCLPKDTQQLLANYVDTPQTLITAIVKANDVRKEFVAEAALKRKPLAVGVYRLTMKSGSDNFRSAAILDVMALIRDAGVDVGVYEPTLNEAEVNGYPVYSDLAEFAANHDVILANRWNEALAPYADKVITADLYARD